MDKSGDRKKSLLETMILTPMKQKVPKIGVRHIQALLIFFYLLVTMLTRSTMSIAVVAMTDNSTSKDSDIVYYKWDNTNIILSSFYWTYIILQPFSGYFFKHFGLRRCLMATVLLNGVAFTLIPCAAASFGYMGVIACRMLQGFLQGFTFPACHASLGLWAPLSERSKLTVLIYSGCNVGVMLAMLITGYISSSPYGWPLVFYIFGATAIAWCVAWYFLGFDSPAKHPRIGEVEKVYIMESLEHCEETNNSNLPIKQILTSLPFWALAVCNIGNTWGINLLDLEIPTYIGKVLGFNINENGVISALPQITQLALSLVFAPITDYIVEKKVLSLMNCRRLFQIFGSLVPSAMLLWLAFIDKSQTKLVIVLLNIIVGLTVFLYNASYINHVDISPRYAGLMLGMENSISQMVGLTGPLFVQYIVTDMSDIKLWSHVFMVISVITVITTLFFMIFGSAKIQWWNSWNSSSTENVRDPLNPDVNIDENKV
ncbi:putative inorganic phosphate cotransporter isoform X2 [Anthonomus grandis grandis]|uniref:putative inorganic phosphate cotransporter isoform X2 n=1 Tax=Anthonomus grandis grandis TaxID=2921223 RepID=UPI002166AA52|nr:putative inorganic phosphate cotransporter isoform X2 [Anthonomus grandis grandis]